MQKYIKNYVILCLAIGMIVKTITIYLNNGFVIERKIFNTFIDNDKKTLRLKSLVTKCTKLYVYALVANPGDEVYDEASIVLLKKLTPPPLFDNAILFKTDHSLKTQYRTIKIVNFKLLDIAVESSGNFSTVASWVESGSGYNGKYMGAFSINPQESFQYEANDSMVESDINCLITNFVIESVNKVNNG